MPRYIDREQALSHPFANGKYDHESINKSKLDDFILGYEGYKEWLETLPTADARDTVHGEWLKSNESALRPYMCSNCGCLYDVDTVMGKIVWNYCPTCGAKMERRRDDVHNQE